MKARKETNKKSNISYWIYKAVFVLFWLFIWQLLAVIVHLPIVLPGPWQVIQKSIMLLGMPSFYQTVCLSFGQIILGLLAGMLFGIVLGAVAAKMSLVDELFKPLLYVIKTAPVTSFILLLLVWVSGKNLAGIIAFFMSFPIFYTGIFEGLKGQDIKMRDVKKVYDIAWFDYFKWIILIQITPSFMTTFKLAVSMSVKAGIAAQIIGIPAHSIGRAMYDAKLYMATDELLAWTLIVIVVGALLEKLIVGVFRGVLAICKNSIRPQSANENRTKQDTICVEDLSFGYQETLLFERLSFSLQKGQKLCLMGKSGCGKTTLLYILCQIIDSKKLNQNARICKASFSMAFQEPHLMEDMNAYQNIALRLQRGIMSEIMACEKENGTKTEDIIRKHLKQLGIEEEDKCIREFSGGMKKRTELISAMLSDSDCVLLDEPFHGLDSQNKEKARDYINTYLMGRPLILVTHDEEDLVLSDMKCLTLSCQTNENALY